MVHQGLETIARSTRLLSTYCQRVSVWYNSSAYQTWLRAIGIARTRVGQAAWYIRSQLLLKRRMNIAV